MTTQTESLILPPSADLTGPWEGNEPLLVNASRFKRFEILAALADAYKTGDGAASFEGGTFLLPDVEADTTLETITVVDISTYDTGAKIQNHPLPYPNDPAKKILPGDFILIGAISWTVTITGAPATPSGFTLRNSWKDAGEQHSPRLTLWWEDRHWKRVRRRRHRRHRCEPGWGPALIRNGDLQGSGRVESLGCLHLGAGPCECSEPRWPLDHSRRSELSGSLDRGHASMGRRPERPGPSGVWHRRGTVPQRLQGRLHCCQGSGSNGDRPGSLDLQHRGVHDRHRSPAAGPDLRGHDRPRSWSGRRRLLWWGHWRHLCLPRRRQRGPDPNQHPGLRDHHPDLRRAKPQRPSTSTRMRQRFRRSWRP